MIARRIIPCLDVRDGRVVKGVRYAAITDAGDIEELAERYRTAGADELVFYDITASPEGRTADVAWIHRVVSRLDIPFCVAGGIRSVEDAERILQSGADKVSINSPALADPGLIDRLAARFGRQCVVVGVDSIVDGDDWTVRQYTGDAARTVAPGRRTLDWIIEAQERGAGEIVLNCMDRDGVRQGFDIEQLSAARAVCEVPLVASGGAGAREHFLEVFREADVDGALGAGAFHDGTLQIGQLKAWLSAQGEVIRC
jgi:imidazole glycerol-phosphate synthase subunit HisF